MTECISIQPQDHLNDVNPKKCEQPGSSTEGQQHAGNGAFCATDKGQILPVENGDSKHPAESAIVLSSTEGSAATKFDQQTSSKADAPESQNADDSVTNGKLEIDGKKPDRLLKNPKEDPIGWVREQTSAKNHKINYFIVQWVYNKIGSEEQYTGKERLTKNDFLAQFRDGTLLARLANSLSPGSVETVHEGEDAKQKDSQISNINGFLKFVEEKAGIGAKDCFSVEDLLEKGKEGYDHVLTTMLQLGLVVSDKFAGKTGLDIEQIVEKVAGITRTKSINFHNIFNTVNNFVSKSIPTTLTKLVEKKQTHTCTDEEKKREDEKTESANNENAENSAIPEEIEEQKEPVPVKGPITT